MRNLYLLLASFFGICLTVHAANLLQVYQQALTSDPQFQQAIAQRFADRENVPINLANLLPQIGVQVTPNVYKTTNSGPGSNGIGSYSTRGYQLNATVTQTLFNFAQFSSLAGANAMNRQAEATLNAAAQSLMLRVSNAYFAVLQDEDNLRYSAANKAAYSKSLDQVNEQYRVGLKTITDVYTAQAGYDSSSARYISAETQLFNDRENLRAITGDTYPSLAKLSQKFPFITPQPADMETWVDTAVKQNWSIKAARNANGVAMQNVKQQFAGHLPTLNVEGIYNITSSRFTGSSNPIFYPPGSSTAHNRTLELNLNVPILSGGQVTAQTHQAQFLYQKTSQQLEQTVRGTINNTRQSYLGVISGISKINADRQNMKSSLSSYRGLKAQYSIGTATLVDVLNQQEKVLLAYQQYAADRYAYINSLLSLKQAAGTLSPEDLAAVNAWLIERNSVEDEFTSESIQKAVMPKHR